MLRLLPLAAAALCLCLAGCGGSEPPVAEASPAPDSAVDPPADADGGSMFASSANDIVMKEAPGALELTFTPEPEAVAQPATTAARAGGSEAPQNAGRTISASQVKTVVTAKTPQVRACYERELKSHAGLKGKVVMGWAIGADGRVSGVRVVSNSTRNTDMVPCLIRAVSGWTFPRAEASFDVEYPFTFKPRDH